jgi:hypothetical protein
MRAVSAFLTGVYEKAGIWQMRNAVSESATAVRHVTAPVRLFYKVLVNCEGSSVGIGEARKLHAQTTTMVIAPSPG